MAAPFIIEAFDEGERRVARLGLCLEPAASEQLALKRGEEALAHGIVVCVAARTHRGAHARVTAAVAELDRAVLGGFKGSSQQDLLAYRSTRQTDRAFAHREARDLAS